MRIWIFTLICALLYCTQGHCRRGARTEISPEVLEKQGPWFTGPLLTASAHVVAPDHFNLEPYLFVTDTYGSYDDEWHAHSVPKTLEIRPLVSFQLGICKNIDFTTSPRAFYTRKQGKASVQFGDLPLGFEFQLLNDTAENWSPAIKLTVREFFPTGKYQKLNPDKNGTDGVGSGSYRTEFDLVFGRLFHTGGAHYLNARVAFTYGMFSHTHVKGFNSYGGGHGTSGTVRPGSHFDILLGLEYSLSLNWALALDVVNVYGNKTSFSGKTAAKVGGPSFDQVSLAPAIEYNFNEALGIIGGAWFTVGGRNTSQFVSGVIAINLYTSYRKLK